MNEKLGKYGPLLVFFITLILLIIHLFGFNSTVNVTIDNITLLLLFLLLISPFASKLKKFKLFGLFEGEIQTEEVEKIKQDIDKLPKKEPAFLKIEYIANEINEMLDHDYISALAKLRIELEKILGKIASYKTNKEIKIVGFGNLLRILQKEGVIDYNLISLLKEIISVCNRAIHGEEIKREDAEVIIESGLILLDELHMIYDEFIIKPYKTIKISKKDLEKYFDSEYEVTTIIPLVEEPYTNKRILTQEGIDALLEGYGEYAEFLIDIKRIEKKRKGD